MPIRSEHADFNKDSIRCDISIEFKKRNIVIPFFIFVSDKKKSKITYRLYGKGLSTGEYTCKFKHLEIKNGQIVLGRSTDTNLFTEKKELKNIESAISPYYATDYLLKLHDAKKLNPDMELEIEIMAKNGMKENFIFKLPLNKVYTKDFKLFNPFK